MDTDELVVVAAGVGVPGTLLSSVVFFAKPPKIGQVKAVFLS